MVNIVHVVCNNVGFYCSTIDCAGNLTDSGTNTNETIADCPEGEIFKEPDPCGTCLPEAGFCGKW